MCCQRLFQETWVVDFAGCFHKHTVLLLGSRLSIELISSCWLCITLLVSPKVTLIPWVFACVDSWGRLPRCLAPASWKRDDGTVVVLTPVVAFRFVVDGSLWRSWCFCLRSFFYCSRRIVSSATHCFCSLCTLRSQSFY